MACASDRKTCFFFFFFSGEAPPRHDIRNDTCSLGSVHVDVDANDGVTDDDDDGDDVDRWPVIWDDGATDRSIVSAWTHPCGATNHHPATCTRSSTNIVHPYENLRECPVRFEIMVSK